MTNTKARNYTLLNHLGQGRFANVVLAINSEGQEVAIKTIDKATVKEKNPLFIKNEIAIMKKMLPCENVVKYIDFFEDDEKANFVLEYLNGFNLQREWYERHVHKNKPMTFDEIKKIMLQIINGLMNLHKQNIYHVDLKPENIILTNEKVFLIDFGCSVICEENLCVASEFYRKGTPGYNPPETSKIQNIDQPIVPEKVDVWAAGVVLYYLFTGNIPFKGNLINNRNHLKNVLELSFCKEKLPENVVKICEKIFVFDILKRLCLSEMKREIENM
ncbi:hypothetical protein GVAV_001193 [Gurleya vavrai]